MTVNLKVLAIVAIILVVSIGVFFIFHGRPLSAAPAVDRPTPGSTSQSLPNPNYSYKPPKTKGQGY